MTDVTPPPAPPAAQPPAVVTHAPKKGGGPGAASLIFAILAILGDLGVLVFAIVSIASLAGNFDLATGLSSLIGFAALALIAFWGGIVFAALALLLGIIAAARNRGRVAGVIGSILAALVLLSHVAFGLLVAGSGDLASSLLP